MCLVCPVSADCRARAQGIQDRLPVSAPKLPPLAVTEACALVSRGRKLLIVKRAPGGLWDGFWEFPTVHISGADPAGRSFGAPVALADGIRRLTGVRATIGPPVQTVRYSVTKHRVELAAHLGRGGSEPPVPGPGLVEAVWETPENLANHPFSAAGRRLVAWVGNHGAELERGESDD